MATASAPRLETQVIRFFEDEVKSRIAEVAAEVWDVVQRRQESGLRRLRNFLEQFRAPGASGKASRELWCKVCRSC